MRIQTCLQATPAVPSRAHRLADEIVTVHKIKFSEDVSVESFLPPRSPYNVEGAMIMEHRFVVRPTCQGLGSGAHHRSWQDTDDDCYGVKASS